MNKIISAISLISITFLNISCESKSKNKKVNSQNEISNIGKVVGIIDGDTYDILKEGSIIVRVRMEGIDAPEKGMPYYKKSKKYLSDLCFGKIVKLKASDKDRDGRTIALSYLEDGTELSHEMVKVGLAWHFKKYNSDPILANLEIDARNAKIGIWSIENPMTPWDNRAFHKRGISTKDSFNIKIYNE